MESKIITVEKLKKEANSFNFENFSNKREGSGFGGSDTPKWRVLKVRVRNFISECMDDSSPANILVIEALGKRTDGGYPDEFELTKAKLISALELAKSALNDDEFGELKKKGSMSKAPSLSNKVFIVHGHDQGLKTDIERFVSEIGLTPVVLHREADQGATIMEKFEKHSDVGYAFILLTPDEISFTTDQLSVNENDRKTEYRARPNVIFEFGYFVGKLGRERVCCLHKGEVVVPSDLDGLVYKKVVSDIDSVAFSIIRELKAAGYSVKI